jgi:beta-galactosidase
MEPIHLDEEYFTENNQKFFLVGTNYMPSKAFFRLWEDWDPDQLENDFRTMKTLGIRAARVPLFWNSVQPEEGVVSSKFLERLDEFLEIAQKHRIYIMPFLFVGVCVDTWDVPWRKGRDMYKDPEMQKLEREQAETLASRYADNPAIIAWDISDEPYYYGGKTDVETATNWVSMIYKALRSRDKKHPITLGFDNNHIIEDTGFQVERLTPYQDFFSLGAYPIYSLKTPEAHTSTRSTYFTPFFIKFSTVGKPVLLSEGPGTSTVWTSLKRAGDYYRVIMYSSFVNGSIGIMPWILIDYDDEYHGKFPLDDKPYETSFGMLTSHGEMKPPAEELKKFSQTIKRIDLEKFHFTKPEAALLVPTDYYKHVRTIWPRLFEAFLLAKEAHMELDFIREGADLTAYKLIIVPSSLVLRTSSWYAFRSYVERGGHLYFSYGGSLVGSPNPLGPFFDEIFGVTLQDRVAPMPLEQMAVTGDWMNIIGLKLTYPNTEGTSCIEVEPKNGLAVGQDARGSAALVVNRALGKGKAILVSHPLEYYLSLIPDAHLSNETFRIYQALRKEAGLSEPFTCDNPFLEVGWMESEDKNEVILIMINHERVGIKSTISLGEIWRAGSLVEVESGSVTKSESELLRLSFEPSEVKIFNLRR